MSSTRDRLTVPAAPFEAIAYHDQLAESWDRRYQRGGFKRRAEFFANKVLPFLGSDGDWLDVGCGSGYFSRLLAARGAKVTGLDGSAEMIAAAKALRSGPAGSSFGAPRYEVQNIEVLSQRQDRFDGVVCLNVIEYLHDPEVRFADLAAMLRPGGTLVVSAPNKTSLVRNLQLGARGLFRAAGRGAFAYLSTSSNAWTRRDFAALAERNGLVVEATMGFDPIVPAAAHLLAPPSLWYLVCRMPGETQ
jgi:2-polyprenyl-3-methyl-5-hydroxy-6-metoxy-1,4-benzoquinol methylase